MRELGSFRIIGVAVGENWVCFPHQFFSGEAHRRELVRDWVRFAEIPGRYWVRFAEFGRWGKIGFVSHI